MAEKRTGSAKKSGKPKEDDVDAFLAALDHPRKPEIETLRALILAADPRVREGVKWNAPSFYVTEHFATFKLRPADTVQVVFHTGARVKDVARAMEIDDPAGLLTWAAPDRCVATLRDMDDVEAKRGAFTSIVRQWIGQMADGEE